VVARIGKTDTKWAPAKKKTQQLCEQENAWTTKLLTTQSELANQLLSYSQERILCPDSGATSIMSPYHDMFIDYVDLRHKL
jgi:hypothetical protein